MTKYITHWAVVFITAFIMIGLHYNDGSLVQTARLKQFDLLQQTDKATLSQDIGVVTIDEAAIEKYGQWPWKRDILADIIWKLREAGAGIIVIPVIMSETDRLGGDIDLAEALAGNGVVIAQTGSTQANRNAVPRGVAKIGDPLPFLFEWPGMLGPIQLLGDNADGVGVLNTNPEIDGVVRRVPLLMRVGEDTYPALAIEVIRVATGAPSYQVKEAGGGIEAVRVPGYPVIRTDPNGQIWLRWNKQFETINYCYEMYKVRKNKKADFDIHSINKLDIEDENIDKSDKVLSWKELEEKDKINCIDNYVDELYNIYLNKISKDNIKIFILKNKNKIRYNKKEKKIDTITGMICVNNEELIIKKKPSNSNLLINKLRKSLKR